MYFIPIKTGSCFCCFFFFRCRFFLLQEHESNPQASDDKINAGADVKCLESESNFENW